MAGVLINFRATDRTWAEWVGKHLNELGYESSLHEWDFNTGTLFLNELSKPAENPTNVVVLLSPAYLQSIHSKPEYIDALKLAKVPILSARVQACSVDSVLGARLGGFIDLYDAEAEEAKGRLLTAAKQRFGSPMGSSGGHSSHAVRSTVLTSKSIWHVPVIRNGPTIGREMQINALAKGLDEASNFLVYCSDRGAGGIGRRQLAREYVQQHAQKYRLVWWLRAEHPAVLAGDYARLAESLGLFEKTPRNEASVVKAVNEWLSQNPSWILIFDNAPNPAALKRYIPKRYAGHILVTSPSPEWPDIRKKIVLREFERQEAIKFIMRETGEGDEGAAAAMASTLSDYPLALRLVAGYCVGTRVKLTNYMDIFTDRYQSLQAACNWPDDHQLNVTTGLSLLVDALSESDPAALELLKLCAYLAPNDIRIGYISKGVKLLPKALAKMVTDPQALQKSLARLEDYGLADVDMENETLSVHPILQSVLRRWILEDPKSTKNKAALGMINALKKSWGERRNPKTTATTALELLAASFPSECADPHSWTECRRLTSGALHTLQYATALEIKLETVSDLYGRLGGYQNMRGQLVFAQESYQKSLAVAEKVLGPSHPNLAEMLKHLGGIEWAIDRMKEARAHFERALALDLTRYKGPSEVVAHDYNLLGGVLLEMEQLLLAQKYYKLALDMDIALKGDKDKNVARDYANLGLVGQKLGDFSKAWWHFERALEINREVYGPKHSSISTLIKNMGGLLRKIGDLPQAKSYLKRALDIDLELYGPGHAEVARDYNNFGLVLQEMGDIKGARECYQKALAIDRTIYGNRHRKVAIQLNNIASVLQAEGNLPEARKYYESALKMFEQAHGKDHPHVQMVRRNLEKLMLKE